MARGRTKAKAKPAARGRKRGRPARSESALSRTVETAARRIRNWRRDVQRLFPVALFAGLAGVTILAVWAWASGSLARAAAGGQAALERVLVDAGFSLAKITVRGRINAENGSIVEALGLELGQSILQIDLAAARERLEKLEWIEEATVMRLLPDTLHIEVVERRPFAVWRMREGDALIDRKGHVITRERLERFAGLPSVVGPGAADAAGELISVLDREPLLKSRLRAAIRVGERRWDLRLDNGIVVYLPDTDVEGAIRELVELDTKHRVLGREIESIDLRFPDRYVIKPSIETLDSASGPSRDGASGVAGRGMNL
ncbi:MAG: cell division protein FtsQ/DivIB [Alphaproteobacteria bacterium]|nr:cell division protein FtsQ/DivIB [Alphaproteobacteria bacterium]